MKAILSLILIFTFQAQADDLLDVLGGESKSIEMSFDKKNSLFKSLLSKPNAEQNIFFQFLEAGDFKKALYQWPSAFENSSFTQSENGKSLYAYLLFKNGLPVTALEKLFLLNPQKINPQMIQLWQGLLQTDDQIWSRAELVWNDQWTALFGVSAEVSVRSRQFSQTLSLKDYEALLRKTAANTWERSWTEWRYINELLLTGEDIKAAKLLKHLESVKENNPISSNLIHLTAARMLYQNGYLTQAIDYYSKVEKASDYWFEALEEMAWAELRMGRPQNTLAHTQTLLVPALAADVGPESFYLASLASLKVCDYTEVSKILKSFRTRFQAKAKVLLALKEQPQNKATQKLLNHLSTKKISTLELGSDATLIPRLATRDEELFFRAGRAHALRLESQKADQLYAQSLSEGTALVGFQANMEKFKNQIASHSQQSFNQALDRLKTLADQELKEISTTLNKMQIVEAELIQQITQVERVITATGKDKQNIKKGTTGSKAKDTLSFSFKGEIWFDELSNYQIDIAKGCQSGGDKTL